MREINDFSGVLREGSWAFGCVAAATALCYAAPEYGYSPVAFFSVFFYLSTGVLRLIFHWMRRSRAN